MLRRQLFYRTASSWLCTVRSVQEPFFAAHTAASRFPLPTLQVQHHQHRGFSCTTPRFQNTKLTATELQEVMHWTSEARLPWLLDPPKDITPEFIRLKIQSTLGKDAAQCGVNVDIICGNINPESFRNSTIERKRFELYQRLSSDFRTLFADDVPTSLTTFYGICGFQSPIPGCHVVGDMGGMKSIENMVQRLEQPFGSSKLKHVEEPERSELFQEPSELQVLVLSGESGSGKTHAALAANPGAPTIFLQFDNEFELSPHKGKSKNGLRDISTDDRDDFVREIMHSIKLCIKSPPQTPFLYDTTIHLVVDELGRKPNRLRLLISQNRAIRDAIAAFLLCHANKIMISCLGTGVNDSSTLLGSDPKQYITRQLAGSGHNSNNNDKKKNKNDSPQPTTGNGVDENVLVHLFREMSSGDRPRSDVDAVRKFSKSPLIAPLLDNYRAAALVATHVLEIHRSTKTDLTFSLKNTEEQCIFFVSHRFRTLNELISIKPEEVLPCCAHAFRLALCGPTIASSFAQKKRLSSEEATLVSRLGILTERPELVEVAKKGKGGNKPTKQQGELPRFRMSRCVALMMLADFGMSRPPISAQSGEGLEFAIVQKAILSFRCCHSLQQVRRVLQCADPQLTADDTLAALSRAARKAPPTTLLHHLTDGKPPNTPQKWSSESAVVLMTPRNLLGRRNKKGKGGHDSSAQQTTKKQRAQLAEYEDGMLKRKSELEKDFPDSSAGGGNLSLLRKIKANVDAGKRVVVLNGYKAAYADVILVAQGFLCFVQCKQTQDEFNKDDKKRREMKKIFKISDNKDITACLCHIAGVHQRDITVLFPTTAKSKKKTSIVVERRRAHGCNLHTAGPAPVGAEHLDVLFPFHWPSTPLPQQDHYTFRVTKKCRLHEFNDGLR